MRQGTSIEEIMDKIMFIKRSMGIVYIMWFREVLRFWRSRSRIIGALITPLTFMFFLGPGLISGFRSQEGGTISINFFAPGLIGMSVFLTSLFSGVSIIWERSLGILKDILITPASRSLLVLGKSIGGATIAIIQGILIMIIAIFIGVDYISPIGMLVSIAVMFLSSIGFIGLGIALASRIESHEGFQVIMSLLAMPLVILSGAFYPISNLPIILRNLVYANPLTYGVETLRWYLFGNSTIPVSLSIIVMISFAIITLSVAGKMFGNIKV